MTAGLSAQREVDKRDEHEVKLVEAAEGAPKSFQPAKQALPVHAAGGDPATRREGGQFPLSVETPAVPSLVLRERKISEKIGEIFVAPVNVK